MSRFPKEVTQTDLDAFARISGDHNPIHCDPGYAATTEFAVPVAHGMCLLSLVLGELQRRWPASTLEGLSLMFPSPTPVGAIVDYAVEGDPAEGPVSVSVVKEDGSEGLRGEITLSPRRNVGGVQERPTYTDRRERHLEKRTFTRDHREALAHLTGENSGGGVPAGLIAGWISKVLGMDLPGAGTNYLKQQLSFHAEAEIGEELTVEVRVARVVPDKRLVYLNTVCSGKDGREIASGRALVLAHGRLPGSAGSEPVGSDPENTTRAGHRAGSRNGEA